MICREDIKIEFGGLIIELLIIFGIPTLIPIFIILFTGNLSYNEKIKKIILFIFSLIYNGIVGFLSFLLLVCLTFLVGDISNMKITFALISCVFAVILIPVNIYMMRKGKINPVLYIVSNIIIFVLNFIANVILIRGTIDL